MKNKEKIVRKTQINQTASLPHKLCYYLLKERCLLFTEVLASDSNLSVVPVLENEGKHRHGRIIRVQQYRAHYGVTLLLSNRDTKYCG